MNFSQKKLFLISLVISYITCPPKFIRRTKKLFECVTIHFLSKILFYNKMDLRLFLFSCDDLGPKILQGTFQ